MGPKKPEKKENLRAGPPPQHLQVRNGGTR